MPCCLAWLVLEVETIVEVSRSSQSWARSTMILRYQFAAFRKTNSQRVPLIARGCLRNNDRSSPDSGQYRQLGWFNTVP
jgi:hypothetical protein